MNSDKPVSPTDTARWLARLRRHIAWLLLIKLGLLVVLFFLFFSVAHRPDIDAEHVSGRLHIQGDMP